MKRYFVSALSLLLSLAACTREVPEQPSELLDGKMVITVGYENMAVGAVSSKTVLTEGNAIYWAGSDADKLLYVFDSKGAKNVFSSTETEESATRSFSGNISEGSEVQWVLWSGKVASEDQSALVEVSTGSDSFTAGNDPIGEGGSIQFETKAGGESHTVFAGSSLRLVNPQNIGRTNSFAQEANIAVMKPGDVALRNVFGYIRFTIPAGTDGQGTIKSVTFSADEPLAGEIQIDYSGDEPRSRIVADGSQTLTVNTPQNGTGYEAGTLYAVLPAGTYHNLKLSVTPVTGEAYTLSSKSTVVVKRGQFTSAGTLSPDLLVKPRIHLAGDSLCAEKSESSAPQLGWGQCLSAALCGAEVFNRAVGGESTKTFIDRGRWSSLLESVEAGDLVLIMFAINDSSSEEVKHTDAQTTYKQNLTKFINETLAKGATPVLLTTMNTRLFDGNTLRYTTVDYVNAMRELATATGTALIDINAETYQFYNNLGVEGTKPYFLLDKRDPSANDNTHITRNGAELVSSMVAHGLKDLGLWKFAISEEPLVLGLINISGSQAFNFEAACGSTSVTFSSTKPWRATSSASWIQFTPTSGAAGENITININVSGYGLDETRSSYVTLLCDGDGKHIMVTQTGVEGGSGNTPNAEDSFDYGLAPGESRQASYSGYSNVGIATNTEVAEPTLLNDVIFGGPGMYFYGNRMTTHKVNNEWSVDYPNIVPSSRYFSFRINKAGSITFYQSLGSGLERIPTYYLAIVVSKNGAKSAKIVDSVTPTKVTDVRPGSAANADPTYNVTLTVPASELEGLDAPATVYLYHRWTSGNTCQVHYYPFTWTSWDGNTTDPTRKPKFLLAGDSTCTVYSESAAPQNGWGMHLSAALGGDARVDNFAIGGESTKSFVDEGKWANLLSDIVSGDYVLIQFGHNDAKTDEAHHTDPSTTYKQYLTQFINDVKERGGIPVLLTSVSRRFFHSNGTPQRTHGDYPPAMRELATATSTALIDIEEQTYQWLATLGPDGSIPYYVIDKRDPTATDNTHLTVEGAQVVAGMVAQGLKTLGFWE